jgi:hypothetical protein
VAGRDPVGADHQDGPGKASQSATWQLDDKRLAEPTRAGRLALGAIAHRVHCLNEQARMLDGHLTALVKRAAPKTLDLRGAGAVHAAELLVAAGQNIDRIGGRDRVRAPVWSRVGA